MSESKWTTVNGVRYPTELNNDIEIDDSMNDPSIDPSIEEKNKLAAKNLFKQYGKPVSSTEVKSLKRTSSPPQKVNSPDKLRKQESVIDDRLEDNFKEIVNKFKPSMDQANQEAANIWTSQGTSAMLKHILTREDGTPMSYAESRARYG